MVMPLMCVVIIIIILIIRLLDMFLPLICAFLCPPLPKLSRTCVVRVKCLNVRLVMNCDCSFDCTMLKTCFTDGHAPNNVAGPAPPCHIGANPSSSSWAPPMTDLHNADLFSMSYVIPCTLVLPRLNN